MQTSNLPNQPRHVDRRLKVVIRGRTNGWKHDQSGDGDDGADMKMKRDLPNARAVPIQRQREEGESELRYEAEVHDREEQIEAFMRSGPCGQGRYMNPDRR